MDATLSLSSARLRRHRRWYPYLYILPGLLAMGLSTLVPGILTLGLAFTNYSVTHISDWKWVGFDNFARILTGARSAEFWGVFSWTFAWAALSTLLAYAFGLGLALLLNNKHLPERNLYRTLLILPWALPSTITILSWTGLFSTSFGPINRLLGSVGIGPVPWLTDPTWARATCLFVNLWLAFPFMMSACLGALQGIPEELYDAGRVDGANSLQSFRWITFPLLRDATIPLVVSGFAMQFGNFGVIYLMTGGGPFTDPASMAGATDLLATYMYKMAFGSTYDYSLAAANGIIIFIIMGGLTLINSWITGAFREAEHEMAGCP